VVPWASQAAAGVADPRGRRTPSWDAAITSAGPRGEYTKHRSPGGGLGSISRALAAACDVSLVAQQNTATQYISSSTPRAGAWSHTSEVTDFVHESLAGMFLVDELGYLQLDRRGAELLFQVLTERKERSAIAIASNEPFSSWTKTFTDPRLCAAIVDRLTFAGQIIETGTSSYRLAHARQRRAAN